MEFLKSHIKPEKQTTYAAIVGIKKCQGVDHLMKCLDEVINLGGEVFISCSRKMTTNRD